MYTKEFVDNLKKDNEVYVVTSDGVPVSDKVYPIINAWKIPALSVLVEIINKIKPDIIDYQYPTTAYRRKLFSNILPLLLLIRGIKTPLITTFHEFAEVKVLGKLRSFLLFTLSPNVIFKNKADLDILLPYSIHKKCKFIPLGASILRAKTSQKKRNTLKSKLNIPEDNTILIFYGFLDENKGIDDLISALGILHSENIKVTLIIVGGYKDQTYYNYLNTLANTSGISESIRWLGFIGDDDLGPYFAIADIAVLPYKNGVSYRRSTLLTAMAHELPIISTNGPYVPHSFVNNNNIMLIDPNKPIQISQAIIKILNDKILRSRLEMGSRSLIKMHDWEKVVNETVSFYSETL